MTSSEAADVGGVCELTCAYPAADAGFHFSRASYVLSLLRPQVMRDLQLKVMAAVCAHMPVPSCHPSCCVRRNMG